MFCSLTSYNIITICICLNRYVHRCFIYYIDEVCKCNVRIKLTCLFIDKNIDRNFIILFVEISLRGKKCNFIL